jgi:protein-disulfide isomerase/uncharacterized membrane protein
MKNITPPSIKFFWITLVAIAGQLGLHTYLAIHHVNLKLGLAQGPSICNVNQSFNCDAVASSSFSEIFGIPIAFLGLVAQLFALALLIASHPLLTENESRVKARYLFYLSTAVAAVSLVMASISVSFVKVFCLFCLFTYLLSFVAFASAYKWSGARPYPFSQDLAELFGSAKNWLIGFILIPFAALALNSLVSTSLKQGAYGPYADTLFAESLNAWRQAPEALFDEAKGLTFQNGNQPVIMTIIEFADFKCPHCKMASLPLHSFVKAHPDVKIIFKPFPLDGACNKALPNSGDSNRCWMAAAPFCAEKLFQKGWQTHDYLFEKQGELFATFQLDSLTKALGTELNIDSEALKACIESDETKELVLATAKEGADAKIEGTPAIFVNNKRLNQGQVLPVLNSVYNELKAK